jgi:hypothetical protein
MVEEVDDIIKFSGYYRVYSIVDISDAAIPARYTEQ